MSMPYVYFEGEINAKSAFAWIRHYCKIISDQHTQDKTLRVVSKSMSCKQLSRQLDVVS